MEHPWNINGRPFSQRRRRVSGYGVLRRAIGADLLSDVLHGRQSHFSSQGLKKR